MIVPWASSRKVVEAKLPVQHISASSCSPGFLPPVPGPQLDIGRLELYAAMARTALASSAPNSMVQAQISAAAAAIDYCVDEGTTGFELSKDLIHLNGSERTALAGRLGAGLCDLFMVSLGYVWRDQADRIISTRKPLADFIYEGPPVRSHGVALAEAKGSTGYGTQTATQKRADQAYQRQVASYIGTITSAGEVVHGYAISLRSPIGKPGYLCIAETGIQPENTEDMGIHAPADQPALFGGRVSVSTAVGNFATALRLIGAEFQGTLLRAALYNNSIRKDAIDSLKRLLDDAIGNYIMGRIHGTFFPYSGTRFGIRPEPLISIIRHLEDSDPEDSEARILELPIFSRSAAIKTNQDEFVEFPDGLAAFSISREEAYGMEASRPPEVPSQELRRAREALLRVLPLATKAKVEELSFEKEIEVFARPALHYESNQ